MAAEWRRDGGGGWTTSVRASLVQSLITYDTADRQNFGKCALCGGHLVMKSSSTGNRSGRHTKYSNTWCAPSYAGSTVAEVR
ncbi:unnamed protein product [Heligmosomoides polygyrus]|uniref:LIM zinc-binding domain-containing protein n=1 Tax=Heligmosomoides polygyrus TaxID=6339 RepID=A0A183FX11_HELPZ|nr:unnamed protein product [Heligmosomoides polygyrus]